MEGSGCRPGAPLYHKAMWDAKGPVAIASGTGPLPGRATTQDGGFGPPAKQFQAGPSKTQPIQIKLLGFAWFYSSGSDSS
jgi:hypothetical protein